MRLNVFVLLFFVLFLFACVETNDSSVVVCSNGSIVSNLSDCPKTVLEDSCLDLGGELCPSDNVCEGELIAGSDCCLGSCVWVNPCDSVSCGVGENCVNGECVTSSVDSCDSVSCGVGEHCVNGECVEEPLTPCKSNEERINGVCVLKSCSALGGLECSSGFSCSKETINSSDSNKCCVGSCVVDNSCDFVFCGKGEECVNGECVDSCKNVSCGNGEHCTSGVCVRDSFCEGNCELKLEVLGETNYQIVLMWDDLTKPVKYVVERAEDPGFSVNFKSYEFSSNDSFGKAVLKYRVFSDTDRLPGSRAYLDGNPFHEEKVVLKEGVNYYYRVKSVQSDDSVLVSNVVSAKIISNIEDIPRGVEGDFYADIILGKKDFSMNTMGEVTPFSTQYPASLVIDKSNNHVFVKDNLNSRVLAYESIPKVNSMPSMVFGQPDFYSSGTNVIGAHQIFPHLEKASASSFRFREKYLVSIAEGEIFSGMAIDNQHNLFVLDNGNNRILKFNNPFSSDKSNGKGDNIADDVWGQNNFVDIKKNSGGNVSASGFRFGRGSSLTIDSFGNLWVADSGNYRVLRFPVQNGVISKQADIVLGQPDFTTRNHNFNNNDSIELNKRKILNPIDIAVGDNEKIYVLEYDFRSSRLIGSRILEFDLSVSKMLATRVLLDSKKDLINSDKKVGELRAMVLDSSNSKLYIAGKDKVFVYNLITGTYKWFKNFMYSENIEIDSTGNMYTVNSREGVYKYSANLIASASNGFDLTKIGEKIISNKIHTSLNSLYYPHGSVLFNNKLIVPDRSNRVLVWNYNLNNLSNGSSAFKDIGEDLPVSKRMTFEPLIDNKNRLWIYRVYSKGGAGGYNSAMAYFVYNSNLQQTNIAETNENQLQLRFENNSNKIDFGPIPVLGGGSTSLGVTRFSAAIDNSGEYPIFWIMDSIRNRALRLKLINGKYTVDVVLGQKSLKGKMPNMGRISKTQVEEIYGSKTIQQILNIRVPNSSPDNPNKLVFEKYINFNGGWEENMFKLKDYLTVKDVEAIANSNPGGVNPDKIIKYVKIVHEAWSPSSPSRESLWASQYISVDSKGNVWISDSGHEYGNTNYRLLEWDKETIEKHVNNNSVVYSIPADRVYGANNLFNIKGNKVSKNSDIGFVAQKIAFDSKGNIVVPVNPYSYRLRFPLVIIDALNNSKPLFALGDIMSKTNGAFFDSEDNLIITSWLWSRVLIYKKPFKKLYEHLEKIPN